MQAMILTGDLHVKVTHRVYGSSMLLQKVFVDSTGIYRRMESEIAIRASIVPKGSSRNYVTFLRGEGVGADIHSFCE